MELLQNLKTYIIANRLYFNKYVIASTFFIIWISFFDQFSLVGQTKLSKTIDKLEKEKAHYIAQLKETEQKREAILNDKEKFARETYNFHKANEEVILIPTKDKSK